MFLPQVGDRVPGDIQLFETQGWEVDKWELTGDLMPVEKHVDNEAGYLYRGSRISGGSRSRRTAEHEVPRSSPSCI